MKLTKEHILERTSGYIKTRLAGEGTGHDWWHVERVRKNALYIGRIENADLFIVELAALLHDIADWKFHDGDDTIGPQMAREWLERLQVDEEVIARVCRIIQDISFKGAGVSSKMQSLEGRIVQDADRLDAMGAVGIARTFAYGGSKGQEIYDPGLRPVKHETFEQYKNCKGSTVNHFYEKLLLLKDLMNTDTAGKMAEHRHQVMLDYLEEFYSEWDGES